MGLTHRRVLLLAATLVAMGTGCRTREAPPEPAEQATTAAPTEAPTPAPAVSREAAQSCREGLESANGEIERVEVSRRLAPALKAIGARCTQAIPSLASAASAAVDLGWQRRSETLGTAARALLPPTCAAGELTGPALEASYACPPPDAFSLAQPLLEDLDAGTYLFALAVREQLGKAGALSPTVDRVLSHLVLAGALEGEARQKAARAK